MVSKVERTTVMKYGNEGFQGIFVVFVVLGVVGIILGIVAVIGGDVAGVAAIYPGIVSVPVGIAGWFWARKYYALEIWLSGSPHEIHSWSTEPLFQIQNQIALAQRNLRYVGPVVQIGQVNYIHGDKNAVNIGGTGNQAQSGKD
jgi:hypothetical protein